VFDAYRTAVAILAAVKGLWPDGFRWINPPYEYENETMPIDILSGSSRLREYVDAGGERQSFGAIVDVDRNAWRAEIADSLLYPQSD